MTFPDPSPSRYFAPALVAIGAGLATANWTLNLDRAPAWIATLALFACLGLVLRLTRGSLWLPRARAAATIRNGVVFAALILDVSLAATFAHALGVVDAADLPRRLAMAVTGAFFVFTGNALPKTLMPLSARHCDGAAAQTLQRFMGWTWVLTGLAFSGAWLALPIDGAEPVSIAAIAAGAIAVATRVMCARATRKEA